ncbi:MAG: hypothetical protein EP305_02255 [Bacteroidetes bacterium]|nr:MAG: hypothetical protein EP305_02255 [Bacteroidota bacterium]
MTSKLIHLREEPTPEIIELLDSIAYGTNGAIYRHENTLERIKDLDRPLFLTLERNSKVIANVTFCRRSVGWYIRFFGFAEQFRSTGKARKREKNSLIKKELIHFFDQVTSSGFEGLKCDGMYAYIESANDRSESMSLDFGFHEVSKVITQTFSRVNPKKSTKLKSIHSWDEVKDIVVDQYKDHEFLHYDQISKGPFWIMSDVNNVPLGISHTINVHWKIDQLPGKFGRQLVKIIPYIPILRRLIKPKDHHFIAVDAVWIKNNDPRIMEEMFAGILAEENRNLMIWWADEKDEIRRAVATKVRWGILDKMIGRTPVKVIARTVDGQNQKFSRPVFVSAFDMV